MADNDPAATAGAPSEPYRGYNFRVDIEGLARGHFKFVEGPSVDIPVMEWREGGDNQNRLLFPGFPDYGPVTLKFGFLKGDSAMLIEWVKAAMSQRVMKKHVTIVNLSAAGNEPLARIELINAWPKSWNAGPLDALGRNFVVHTLQVVYESLNWA